MQTSHTSVAYRRLSEAARLSSPRLKEEGGSRGLSHTIGVGLARGPFLWNLIYVVVPKIQALRITSPIVRQYA